MNSQIDANKLNESGIDVKMMVRTQIDNKARHIGMTLKQIEDELAIFFFFYAEFKVTKDALKDEFEKLQEIVASGNENFADALSAPIRVLQSNFESNMDTQESFNKELRAEAGEIGEELGEMISEISSQTLQLNRIDDLLGVRTDFFK